MATAGLGAEVSRRKKNFAAKGLKDPKECFVLLCVLSWLFLSRPPAKKDRTAAAHDPSLHVHA